MANKKIEIFFPNTETENPIHVYNNVTGYITTKPISMEDFIKKNKLEYASGFSDTRGRLKDGRSEQIDTTGGKKSKKRRPKRISKKSCKRRK